MEPRLRVTLHSPVAVVMSASLVRLLRLTFLLSLGALVALGVTLAVLFTVVWRAERLVRHTQEVSRLARTSLLLAVDRETGIRGYLLTGNAVSLEPERAARGPLRARLDSLVAITRVPEQRVRVRAIRAALDRWEREFAAPILAGRVSERRSAPALDTLAGKALFDQVRAGFGEFLRVEDQVYRDGVRRAGVAGGATVAVAVVELVVVALMLLRFRNQLVAQVMVSDEQAARLERQALELEASNEALQRVVQDLEAFSYSVAHDLRAPLRALDGYSHALLEDYEDRLDPEGRGYLERIRENTQRMGQLIDGILSLSRIGRGTLHRERLDLSAMARRVADDLRAAQPERAVEVRVPGGLSAEGDPRLVGVLLQNLIGNAWKFTAGRTPGVVELGTSVHDGERVYFVRDNGVGFDPAFGDRLFRPFERLHGAAFEGHGLGLATVQRIVRRHGGRVWAEGAVDAGTTIYFTLPDARR